MIHETYQMTLKRLTENAFNKHPVSISCLIFKNNDNYQLEFTNHVIDKDVLGQLIYELINSTDVNDNCIPIIISLEDNTISQMNSKGVYILDTFNNQFIYLFGVKDQENFFNKINKIRSESKINTSLVICYLSNAENPTQLNQKQADKLNCLVDLHGEVYGKYTLLDYTQEINFPLLNKDFKLNLFHWIIRNESGKNDE